MVWDETETSWIEDDKLIWQVNVLGFNKTDIDINVVGDEIKVDCDRKKKYDFQLGFSELHWNYKLNPKYKFIPDVYLKNGILTFVFTKNEEKEKANIKINIQNG